MLANKELPLGRESAAGFLTALFFESEPVSPRYGDVFYYHRFSGTLQGVRDNLSLWFSSLGGPPQSRVFLGLLELDVVKEEIEVLLKRLGAEEREVVLEEVSHIVRFRIR